MKTVGDKATANNHRRIVIVYDSAYGNTAEVAGAVTEALDGSGVIRTQLASEVSTDVIRSADLLIVGSPTQGGRPTKSLQDALDRLPEDALSDVFVAAFDTRFSTKTHGVRLRLLMNTIGFAAEKIASQLRAKGGSVVAPPAGFIVEDKPGPLAPGELERARSWALELPQSVVTKQTM